MKVFKVNKYITVKLEHYDTVIYIGGEIFRQCKRLLLNLEKSNFQKYDYVTSIDDIAEQFENEKNINDVIIEISPEIEFTSHCSNLQAWAEYDYDTRLLHRNLAFPLLKELTKMGDPLAQRVFKEEIAKRLDECVPSVTNFLIEEGLINYLDKEELLLSVLTPEEAGLIQNIETKTKSNLTLVNVLEEETKCFIVENKRVVILDLTRVNLSEIPIEITKLKHLKELWLGGNYISNLPKELLNLKNLKVLVLWGNELKQLPNWVVGMDKLEGLYLSSNPLPKLPEEIGRLKSLEELDLLGCKITSLPNSIYSLKNLTLLDISDNKFKRIPKKIAELKSLKVLRIEGNPLD